MLMSRKHEAISMIRGSIIKVSMVGEFTEKLVVFEVVCDSPNFRRTLRLVQAFFFLSYKIGVYYCCLEL